MGRNLRLKFHFTEVNFFMKDFLFSGRFDTIWFKLLRAVEEECSLKRISHLSQILKIHVHVIHSPDPKWRNCRPFDWTRESGSDDVDCCTIFAPPISAVGERVVSNRRLLHRDWGVVGLCKKVDEAKETQIHNPWIMKAMLYQLSYLGSMKPH